MSAYVVTETGVVIRYQEAGCISWESDKNHIATLYRRKEANGNGAGFIAKVPRGCVVSFDRPHAVQQAQDAKRTTLKTSLEIVCACLDTMPVDYTTKERLRQLKAKLAFFDARSGRWKRP